ncbi:hypothetical protein CC1G_06344 [Coprinopsis cinerea okayama7|uniref:Uncharacterized protein n=1 Tax=Coprinopsis cinerea (strain Okayama-7 / 130 / ATCC MYA-4618 / FGSC 9003) TaxID=240176 RepID=A8NTL3_COPC7|nr:hypothetical protein CC1G_06344 [Coprinopsis cinerea okayama7\|eukprot:XP_001836259.2 hypothetical protein CC1G_06344 [Coprinopsis cinerea okayama7\
MSSTHALRRASALTLASRRPVAQVIPVALRARSRSNLPEEPDPQLNGYPQLPWVPKGSLPARGWDDMLERRNFGEPLHEQEEVLSMWGPDVPPVPPQTALRHFLFAVTAFIGAGFTIKYYLTPDAPAIKREYPYNGLIKELGGLEENKASISDFCAAPRENGKSRRLGMNFARVGLDLLVVRFPQ